MGIDRSPPPRLSLTLRLTRGILRLAVKPALSRLGRPGALRALAVAGSLAPFPRPDVRTERLTWNPGGLVFTPAGALTGVRLLWFHGGAYVACSPRTHRGMIVELARAGRCQAIAPAYRLAPEHPEAAAFEDGVAFARRLMAEAQTPLILGGDSAGGGLAAAVAAALCLGGQPPAGLLVLSPWTDLTGRGASHIRNAAADPMLPTQRLHEIVAMVAGRLDPADPRLSPAFARFPGLPAAFISVGSEEILLDDARMLARALQRDGAEVSLHERPGAPHVLAFFAPFVPEARDEVRRIGAWLRIRAHALAAEASR